MQKLILVACCALVAAGCASTSTSSSAPDMSAMEMPVKPDPAPEMEALERMVGRWSGTAEMIEPPMPEGAPNSFRGGNRMEWALDGMFLRGEGWYEMGEGQRAHYQEYWTWDPKKKKYRSWMFSDWGETGSSLVSMSDDGNTMTFVGTGLDATGNASAGKGTMRFVNDNTMEWTWTQTQGMKMKMKGTSRRRP